LVRARRSAGNLIVKRLTEPLLFPEVFTGAQAVLVGLGGGRLLVRVAPAVQSTPGDRHGQSSRPQVIVMVKSVDLQDTRGNGPMTRHAAVSTITERVPRSCDLIPLRASRSNPVPVTFRATRVLPYEHVDRATAGLRAELRRQLLKANVYEMPMWETLTVTGPHEFTDLRGRTWYEYRATVESRSLLDRTTSPGAPRT
jgi:hypothetical protein